VVAVEVRVAEVHRGGDARDALERLVEEVHGGS
jgi:hypothetical protein